MRYKPWHPGYPCPVCHCPVLAAADLFQKNHAPCRPCGNQKQAERRRAKRKPRIRREKPVKVEEIKEPMTCLKCKENPQKPNSRKGLCESCTTENTLAKARLRAADQHRRRMADALVVLCACGCGERCRSGATYATKQHRETHERETREKHRQPRTTVKPPDDYKLKHMTKAEKREVVEVPVLDSEAERSRVAALLERARANRIPCQISRFSDDRNCLL